MDQVAQIKDKLDIVSFVSEYVPLKKAGRNFKANCPFHNEKSPSFIVSPDRQTWHCFGSCSKGGDVYAFLMEYEKVEFGEALRILAKRTGIELTSQGFDSGAASQKEAIYRINSLAKEYYHYVLTKHKAGEKARAYLEERGITAKIIETFMLGFSPEGSGLSDYLTKKKKFRPQDIIDAGLAFQRGNRLSDFFYGRLMFPLIDHRDNVVGFSGRILDKNDTTSKYINTRETLAYHKGDHFYGLNITKDAIRKEGQAIIVEGEFDVISCFQNGIGNVVGVKGTALTENQVTLLARYAQKITFCFDGDKAGQNAIKRSLIVVEKKDLTPTVIEIPGGKDPDESLKNEPGLFKKAVREDIGIYDYLLSKTLASSDVGTPEGKKEVADTLLPFIANIKNEIIKEHFIKRISSELDTSRESIAKEMQRLTIPNTVKIGKALPRTKRPKEEILEEYLLSLVLQAQQPRLLIDNIMVVLADFLGNERSCQKILHRLAEYMQKDNADVHMLANTLPQELVETYDTCLLFPLPEFIDQKKLTEEVTITAHKLKVAYIQNKMKKLAEEIDTKEGKSEEDGIEELKRQYSELAKQLDTA